MFCNFLFLKKVEIIIHLMAVVSFLLNLDLSRNGNIVVTPL